MKNPTLATLLSLFLALLLALSPATAEEPARTLTALGTGTAYARPDTAEVRLVVFTEAALASSALADNAALTERLLRRLSDLGVSRRDVQSYRSAVRPKYSEAVPGLTLPEVIGYQVGNDVRAKVRRLDKLGAVLDGLDSNLVQGVRLTVDDPSGLYKEARTRALADARRRAEQYARDAGLELGEVLDVREQTPEADRTQDGDEQELRASVAVTFAVTKRQPVEMASSR
jgi:uncharacterized protein YggE